MGYEKSIYDAAYAELERRKETAERTAREKAESFHRECPRALGIKQELAENASGIARAVLSGGDVRSKLEALKARSLALRNEYRELLAEHKLTETDISPAYTCPQCRDTGFIDGMMCNCLKRLQRSIAYSRLSMNVPLEKSTFETFSLDFYKSDPAAYERMKGILAVCKEYAERFRANSSSLLFKGGTGLGKTHLSLAIANRAIEKGFGVIYDSAQSFAAALEKERFERINSDAPEDTNSRLIACDLLIIDDLGTVTSTNYVVSALYNIINSRMLSSKPTIISTNLSMEELERRYSERFASRVTGYYGKFEFLGSDVRKEMRRKKQNSHT